MPQIRKSVLVPYSAERMFALVARVPEYPRFMPWCGGARESVEADGRVRATVDIDFRGVRSSFTTMNSHEAPARIAMRLAEGPFADLAGEWRFTPLDESACKVEFRLDYEFASSVLGRVVAPVFDSIANSFIDAFARRAEDLYG
ncbi:MAG: type II toxin-antitoxin system RatA family toxin [Burkholderiales bacterium]|nr:type II toxin-antitoxin system RatA family toxin [Burkholderiales bacterium]